MEGCSDFEVAACKFIWTRDGIILNISTVGMDTEFAGLSTILAEPE
jgi:hypothetical protein